MQNRSCAGTGSQNPEAMGWAGYDRLLEPRSNSLVIRHLTTYRYRQPVKLGVHRLMLRPRESLELRLISNDVTITPGASATWAQDVFGNAVGMVTFQTLADTLVIESVAELQLAAERCSDFEVAASALSYPFLYTADEWIDIGALAVPQYRDPDGRLKNWARAFVRGNPTDTLSLLKYTPFTRQPENPWVI